MRLWCTVTASIRPWISRHKFLEDESIPAQQRPEDEEGPWAYCLPCLTEDFDTGLGQLGAAMVQAYSTSVRECCCINDLSSSTEYGKP